MNIDSIHNGVVIDHIPAGHSMTIYRLLKLDSLSCSIAIIKNVKSNIMGKKDIIKIDDTIAIDFEVLGYVDPGITVNIIRNGVRVDKKTLSLPKTLTNVLTCKNPRCITGSEQEIDQVFVLADADSGLYRCQYCETAAEKR